MKRLLLRCAAVVMVVVLMTGSAFAAGGTTNPTLQSGLDFGTASIELQVYEPGSDQAKILQIAEKANEDVTKEIFKACDKAEKAKSEAELDRIIEKLLNNTQKVVSKAITKIEDLGGEAECVYVEIQIGGRAVLVDPLRIVRL